MSKSLAQPLKTGDVFKFKTHAEFLNELFGTDYKNWGRCSWEYTYDILVWFVRINDKKRGGFKNEWYDNNTIIQTCSETKNEFGGKPLNSVRIPDYRLVFEIIDKPNRKYIFQGFFRYNREKSVPKRLIFERIADAFPLK